MIAKKIFYAGHVQGVGFRYSVKQIAAGFDLSGWVRNLPDGRVELALQGEAKEVEALIEDIERSHLNGFIKESQTEELGVDTGLRGFSIRT